MENPFKIFTSPIFGQVRAAYIDGVAWFVGKDVCRALSYERGDMALRRHVQEEDRKILFVATFQSMKAGKSVKRRTTVINESGLYSLVLASQMPAAQEFKHWVTAEVLPAIRKTGSYSLFEQKAETDAAKPVEKSTAEIIREVKDSQAKLLASTQNLTSTEITFLRAEKLIAIADRLNGDEVHDKILLQAANLLCEKNIF